MFQIHIVDRSNRSAYEELLDDYFRIRHDIYVGERGWVELFQANGREIDAFDTEDAIYLLGICPKGKIVAGSRFVSSLKPHLLNEVFPQLADEGVPRAVDIFEWTRVFVVPALRTPGVPSRAAGILYCGIVEFCLERGIRQLSVVCEPYWLDRLTVLGWKPSLLGKPFQCNDGVIVGLLLEMSKEALAATQQAYGIMQSVLSKQRAFA